MEFRVLTLIAVVVGLKLVGAKVFNDCEFATELYLDHQIPREEVYKHLCIATAIHQTHGSVYDAHLGIYGIGRRWWCGMDEAGGSCHVQCSNLVDDDISDDVACAKIILSQQGVGAWGSTESSCKRIYQEEVDRCLVDVDVLLALKEASGDFDEISTSTASSTVTIPTTTVAPSTSTSSTTSTSTSTTQATTTTAKNIESSQSLTTTEGFRARPSTRYFSSTSAYLDDLEDTSEVSGSQQMLKTIDDQYKKDTKITLWMIVALILVSLLVILIYKYRNLNRPVVEQRRQFNNPLLTDEENYDY